MATCTVDVSPKSIVGVPCGRAIRDGKCPVHGIETEPSVFDHPKVDIDKIVLDLFKLAEGS